MTEYSYNPVTELLSLQSDKQLILVTINGNRFEVPIVDGNGSIGSIKPDDSVAIQEVSDFIIVTLE